MTASNSGPGISSFDLTPLWTKSLDSPIQLSLARERGWLLVQDKSEWLYLFSAHNGAVQSQREIQKLKLVTISDDASAIVIATKNGEVASLGPDLMTRWQINLSKPATALCVDPFGLAIAVCDRKGRVFLIDRSGRLLHEMQLSRPLQYMAFVPSMPYLVGCADFGLICLIDMNGQILWQDGLVVNVGGMAVDGKGEQILLACFSEGILRYHFQQKKQPSLPVGEGAEMVAQSFSGERLVVVQRDRSLCLLEPDGQIFCKKNQSHGIATMAISALGNEIFIGSKDNTLACHRVVKL